MALTIIRIEGFEGSVAYRSDKLSNLLGKYGSARVEADAGKTAAMWAAIRDVEPFHTATGDVWRVSCKPSDGPAVVARMQAKDVIFDWGGGLIWALVPGGTNLRKQLGDYDGHATLIRADAATRERLGVFQPQSAPIEALNAGLRSKFDPRNILNPGKIL